MNLRLLLRGVAGWPPEGAVLDPLGASSFRLTPPIVIFCDWTLVLETTWKSVSNVRKDSRRKVPTGNKQAIERAAGTQGGRAGLARWAIQQRAPTEDEALTSEPPSLFRTRLRG